MATINTNPSMIVDPKRAWTSWNINQIFVPGGAGGLNVPNIDDQIIQWGSDRYFVYRCSDVDYTTGKSTLQLMHESPYVPAEGVEDVILSSGPGTPIESFRAYVDKSVKPATISIDRQFFFLGTDARYVKIYKGTDTSPQGQVVSAMYDQGNELIGENIPLKQVATARIPAAGLVTAIDSAVKIVETGYLTTDLVDNEVITVVAFGDAGNIVQQRAVTVYNTSFARQVDSERRYVLDVELDTQFLSEGDDNVIVIPRNMTLESVLTMCKVLYSDGTPKRVPIDGTKAALHGMYSSRYIANSDGVRAKVVLMYRLDENEWLYGAQVGEFPHKSRAYSVESAPFEKAFACRIWALPQWVDANNGYRMRYYLTTLRRDTIYDITDKVRFSPSSPSFNPLAYGQLQNLILQVDMNKVDSSFKAWKYVQPTGITLFAPASEGPATAYTVNYEPTQGTVHGLGLQVKGDYRSAGFWLFDISMGAGSLAAWLDKMFYAALPIYNPTSETRAPAPTHFNMICAGVSKEFAVASWKNALQMSITPAPGEQVRFEWILRDGNGDHLLGVTSAPMFQVD